MSVPQRLLLISPVRNEEAHFERIADAVVGQTRPPDRWVVVDDASTDRTPEILAGLADRIGFLEVVNAASRPQQLAPVKDRLATAAEARAFNLGLDSVEWRSFTHIAKLDGTLSVCWESSSATPSSAWVADCTLTLIRALRGRAGRWSASRPNTTYRAL
jgi:cellulose synthase/poly-beta-1,6-N-acetylglucosamine synthase-like glycosyltransferase